MNSSSLCNVRLVLKPSFVSNGYTMLLYDYNDRELKGH